MTISSPVATITATGISAPSYADILQYFQEKFQAIYGADAYIAADSQDGQWIAVLAKAISDSNAMAVAVFNSFHPSYAQGTGLSSIVKINGIARRVPSNSTAAADVVGVAGTVITDGVAEDTNGNLWDLPASVVIPGGGSVSVTLTAQEAGAVAALSGTINKINNPQLGWQTVASTADAVVGDAVETDAQLRRRQLSAASLPSISPLAGMLAALEAIDGISDIAIYENYTAAPDVNGIPARSICVVIEGVTEDNEVEVVTVIGQKKTPGANTYGTEIVVYYDPLTRIPYTIHYQVLAYTVVTVAISVDVGDGWNTSIEDDIKERVANYISSLAIGAPVQFSRVYGPAYLNGQAAGNTYEITVLELNGGVVDIPIAFDHAAKTTIANVTITIVP